MRGLTVPEPTEDFTADPVELFFDLAFVFAFSQLVSHLIHHPTWSGAGEAALLFTVLWLAWSTFTWAANAVQGNAREVRAVFLIATAASVPIGASVSTAYGSGGGTFAIGATVIVLMGIGLQLWAFAGDENRTGELQSIIRYGIPNLLASSLLIVGAFLDKGPRTWMWLGFVLVIIGGIGAARSGEWLVRSGHFAERHGLILIIALGEIVVAIGISVVNSLTEADGLPPETLVALTASGALIGLLWWAYFDRVLSSLEHKAESLTGQDRGRFVADVYTGFHVGIVGGVIATAAAAEEILLHPKDPVHTEFLVMFVGGLALFFVSISGAVFRAYRVIAKERLIATIAIAAVAYFGRSWDGVTLLVVVDALLLVMLIGEHVRIERPTTSEPIAEQLPA